MKSVASETNQMKYRKSPNFVQIRLRYVRFSKNVVISSRIMVSACFGSTPTKTGMIQRISAWFLCKNDMHICEVFHILKVYIINCIIFWFTRKSINFLRIAIVAFMCSLLNILWKVCYPFTWIHCTLAISVKCLVFILYTGNMGKNLPVAYKDVLLGLIM